jgi:hypothetical protein
MDASISHIRIAISRRFPFFPERGYASNLNPTLQKTARQRPRKNALFRLN